METIEKGLSKSKIWWWFILIFVCLGSREYQFDRLLIELDQIVEEELISEDIFAQIGKSIYKPKNFQYTDFLSSADFEKYQEKASLIISHGGTGALINALKKGKSVIAVPRLAKFGEHIDDHQVEVASILEREGYLKCVIDIKDLHNVIKEMKKNPINKKYDKNSQVISIIRDFIKRN